MPTMPTDREAKLRAAVGVNIRAAREKAGWTQRELALRCGEFDQALISRWERGEALPELRNLCLIAWELGVSVSKLYSENGRKG